MRCSPCFFVKWCALSFVALAAAITVVVFAALATITIVVFVTAFLLTVAVAAAATIATAATTALVTWWVLLLFRGLTHVNHLAGIFHSLACKLMVEIDGYLVISHFLDDTFDAHAVACHHRHESALKHTVTVKLSIYNEERFVKHLNKVGITLSKRLDW